MQRHGLWLALAFLATACVGPGSSNGDDTNGGDAGSVVADGGTGDGSGDDGDGSATEICDNGVSDDGDQFVDCDDFDCGDHPACASSGTEICDNGVSDDGDQFVDCDDFDCDDDPACSGGGTQEICDNGISDDGDQFVDCDDFDCGDDPACGGSQEICDNGVSDDGDPFVDCDDFDCDDDPACGGGGGGDTPAIDEEMCTGYTTVATPLAAPYARAIVEGGEFRVLVTEQQGDVPVGELALFFELSYLAGQHDYPPTSGLVRGALVEATSEGWDVVEQYAACEAGLDPVTFSSDANTCDGRLGAAFLCLDGTNDLVGASVEVPFAGQASDFPEPSCFPTDASCSANSDCCSGSCSPAIGVCN